MVLRFLGDGLRSLFVEDECEGSLVSDKEGDRDCDFREEDCWAAD